MDRPMLIPRNLVYQEDSYFGVSYLIKLNSPKSISLQKSVGGTAASFVGHSAYAVNSKKDFSFMKGMLIGGMITVFVLMLANLFLAIPGLQLAISGFVILLMSGFILMETSSIVRGGETNYIMATYGMYLSIFNIFIHLLAILGIMSED